MRILTFRCNLFTNDSKETFCVWPIIPVSDTSRPQDKPNVFYLILRVVTPLVHAHNVTQIAIDYI